MKAIFSRVSVVLGSAVRLERRLVLPDLEDRELVRLIDALHDLAAQIAAFLLHALAVAAEQSDGLRLRDRHDLDVA